MIQKICFFLSAISAITLTFVSSPAIALYDEDTETVYVEDEYLPVFSRKSYTVEFLNTPRASVPDFTMRLGAYGEMTGCATMSDTKLKLEDQGENKAIEVRDSQVVLENKAPRYTNYDCEIKANRSFIDVPLNRDNLIANKTRYLLLNSEKYGQFFTSEITVTKEKMDMVLTNKNSEKMITYWFFPANTIYLDVPGAKGDENIMEQLYAFARDMGMSPVEEVLDGYTPPPHAIHGAAFVDNNHVAYTNLGEEDDASLTIGQITAVKTIYTTTGPTEEPYGLDVRASYPPSSIMVTRRP